MTQLVKQPGSSKNDPTLSMREIFFGSKIEVLKIIHQNSQEQQNLLSTSQMTLSPDPSPIHQKKLVDHLSERKEKLGPIYLDIKPGQRLYEAWDEAF